jgi:hypothetical protein
MLPRRVAEHLRLLLADAEAVARLDRWHGDQQRDEQHEVGTSGAVCVVTEAVPPYTVLVYHCVGTLSLRHGQITLQGLIEVQGPDDTGPFVVAITGGTGAYRGAGGEAVVHDPIGPRRVYKLSFDSKHKKKHRRH